MSEEEFVKLVEEIPSVKTKSVISSYNSINVNDLQKAVARLNKIPSYNDLLNENKQLKENNQSMQAEMTMTWNKLDKKEKKLNEIRKIVIQMQNNFKQEEHIGTAYDDDIFYDDILEILEEVNK